MAKKGGTSEINGFVNIKTEDASSTKQKVSSKSTGSTKNIKSNTSKSTRKEEFEESKSKRLDNKDSPETKKVLESKATKVSKSTVSSSSKTKVQVSQNASKTHSDPSKPLKSNSNPTKVGPRKDQGIDKTKKTDSTSKTRISKDQKVNSRRVLVQDESKLKQTLSHPSPKGAPLVTNKSSEKVSLNENRIKRVSNEADKERTNKLEGRKGEPSKNIRKTKEPNKTSEKEVNSSKHVTSKSYSSLKNSNGSLLKQKTLKTTKLPPNEKEKKSERKTSQDTSRKISTISETVVSEVKVELPQEDIKVKSSYKDLIYFEVDMGNAEQPTKSRTKSAQVKSSTSQPPPISRQGTFIKDESLELEGQVTEKDASADKPTATQVNDEEVEYEDDFEDYESDFEEYISGSDSESGLSSKSETDSEPAELKSSMNQEALKPVMMSISNMLNVKTVEEEKKLDSGSYDLSSKAVYMSLRQKKLDLIREAITHENRSMFDKRNNIIPGKPIPEGSKVVALDFVSAFKRREEAEKNEKDKKRSTIILQMIKLHEKKIDLFAVTFSDDIFQQMYQNRNISHVCTETDLIMKEEETQTNEIKVQNKWTQHPTSYHPWSSNSFSFKTFLEDQRGYGGDNISTDYNTFWNFKFNAKKLYNFIDAASKVILITLEEEARWKSDEKSVSIANLTDDLGFSDGCIPIKIDNLSFLKDRPISDILFSPHDSNIFVSSHRFIQDIEKLASFTDQFFGRSILCIWSILEPSLPLYLLVASCQISAISFDSEYDNFIYAGLTDGSVCMWDLHESSMYHKETIAGSMEYLLRTPTYCSSHLAGEDYHQNVIVAIKSLGFEIIGRKLSQKFNPTQIITMDTDGKVVLWIVTRILSYLERTEKSFDKYNSGMSFWGKFKLEMGKTLNPENLLPSSENKWGLQFLCMSLAPEFYPKDKISMRSILVGTNLGNIIHFFVSEDDTDVPIFSNENGENYAFSVMCIERNPHGFPVFLAGCNDGKIRFYVLDKSQPFKIVSTDGEFVNTPVVKIRWSPLGLGLFLALDKNFCLHFWDICKGDHSPQTTVSLKALQAAHFDLTYDNKFVYIGLSVKRVKIDIHRLKEKFSTAKSEEERDFFIQFVKNNSNLLNKS